MYPNTPVTPQMAELGAAIVTAVEMILDNPSAAKSAAEAHAKAVALTADEVAEAVEARDLIKQAAELRKELQEGIDSVDAREKKLAEDQLAFKQQQTEHTSNVSNLNRAVDEHDTRLEAVEAREKKLDDDEKELANNWQLLRKSEEAVKEREAAVRAREDAAKEFANKLGGKTA